MAAHNDVTMTVVLEANNERRKLFKDPTIRIVLPKEIEGVDIVGDIDVLHKEGYKDDSLTVEGSRIYTENGSKVIEINLKGEQIAYNKIAAAKGANIVMNLKLRAANFMATKTGEIITTCVNGEDTKEIKNNIDIVAKEGLLAQINVDGEVVDNLSNINIDAQAEAKTSNVVIRLINNYNTEINNVVLGTKLETQEDSSLNNATLREVTLNGVDGIASQTIQENKEYSLNLDSFAKGQELELTYSVVLPENVGYNQLLKSLVTLTGVKDDSDLNKEVSFMFGSTINNNETESNVQNESDTILLEVIPETSSEFLHENQIVLYTLKVTNKTQEELSNLSLEFIKPNNTTLIEGISTDNFNIDYSEIEENSKKITINHLNPNETREEVVYLLINSIDQNEVTILGTAVVKDSNEAELLSTNIEQKVRKSNIGLTYSTSNGNAEIFEDSILTCILLINNPSQEKVENCLIQVAIPEGATFVENKDLVIAEEDDENSVETTSEEFTYNKDLNTLTAVINEINEEDSAVLQYNIKIDKLPNNISSRKLLSTALVSLNNEIYETGIIEKQVLPIRYTLEVTANHGDTIKEREEIKYTIKAKNIGGYDGTVKIEDEISEFVAISEIVAYLESNPDEKVNLETENDPETERNTLNYGNSIEPGETLVIEITGTTNKNESQEDSVEITNFAKLFLDGQEIARSNVVRATMTIEKTIEDLYSDEEAPIVKNYDEIFDGEETGDPDEEVPDEPDNPDDPTNPDNPDDPTNPDNPDDPTNPDKPKDDKLSISGLAWIDENKNGIRDNNEEVAKGVKVTLVDSEGNVVKDEEGDILSSTTSITGTYKFSNLEKGQYLVLFEYDTNKYTVTKYQVEDADEKTNSDAISKKIETEDEDEILAAITDTLKLEDKALENIDIGLITNPKFDLSINKYVSKITVTTKTGTTTYEYQNTKLAKVEIGAKKLEGAVLLVEYEIEIQNNGEVDGYVSDIIDHAPSGLNFNSELNSDWYQDSKDVLHNVSLTQEAIPAGQNKTVKLVFTKTLTSTSPGTIDNKAEIGESTNIEGIKEIDKEDNVSSASLIIAIATGSPTMYIGIVIISLLVLGAGIYLIDKKVMKGGE